MIGICGVCVCVCLYWMHFVFHFIMFFLEFYRIYIFFILFWFQSCFFFRLRFFVERIHRLTLNEYKNSVCAPKYQRSKNHWIQNHRKKWKIQWYTDLRYICVVHSSESKSWNWMKEQERSKERKKKLKNKINK